MWTFPLMIFVSVYLQMTFYKNMLYQKHFSNLKTFLLKVSFYFSECPIGYIGLRCSQRCPTPKYGRFCLSTCSCSTEQCNAITGCSEGKFVWLSLEGMAVCITRTSKIVFGEVLRHYVSHMPLMIEVFFHRSCFMMSSVLCQLHLYLRYILHCFGF